MAVLRVLAGVVAGTLAMLASIVFGTFAVVAVAVLFTVVLALVSSRSQVLAGAALGVAGVLLAIAYVNRSGPGTTCTTTADAVRCDSHLNPVPWFVGGIVFLVLAVVLGAHAARAARS